MEDPNAVMIDVRNFNESVIGRFNPPKIEVLDPKMRSVTGATLRDPPPPLPHAQDIRLVALSAGDDDADTGVRRSFQNGWTTTSTS